MPQPRKAISAVIDGLRRKPDLWRSEDAETVAADVASSGVDARAGTVEGRPRHLSIRWKLLIAFVCMAAITFFLGAYADRVGQRAALVGLVVGLSGMTAIFFLTPLAWPWFALVGSVGGADVAAGLAEEHRDLLVALGRHVADELQ